jgi:hypothetical protein
MADDVTLGELARRMDGLHGDVRQIRDLLLALPQQYIPRQELDERRGADVARVAAMRLETTTTGRRWLLGFAAPTVVSLAAVVISATHAIH